MPHQPSRRKATFELCKVLLLLGILAATGCYKTIAPPPPSGEYQGILANERLQESLFKGDQEVLSNSDIERILSAHVTLGDRHRLAVLSLSPGFAWLRSAVAHTARATENISAKK